MKAVILAEDDVIDGMPRVAGEVVLVVDDYGGPVRRVVAVDVDKRRRKERDEAIAKVDDRKKGEMFREGLEKLQAILQEDYRQFWNALLRNPDVQEAIIAEMREQPHILRRALGDTQWFVDEVTRRFKANKNAK